LLLAITILFASLGATTAADTVSNDTQIEATTSPATIEESTPIKESTSNSIEKDTTAQKEKKILKADNTQTIYVNSNGSASVDGSDINNPTTITNALKLVQDNGEIHLVTLGKNNTDTYTNRITINNNTVPNATTFSIIGEEGKTINFIGNTTMLYIFNSNFNISLKNLNFINTTSYEGAAIYSNSILDISNCNFINNSAEHVAGAIRAQNNITIKNSNFIENKAYSSGALLIIAQSSKIINCSFINNTAINSTATMNYNGGGAITLAAGGNYTINNSKFINNSANNGGAIYSRSNVSLIITNTTFDSNYGFNLNVDTTGAITMLGVNTNFTSKNNTFKNNKASAGAAICVGGSMSTPNCNSSYIITDTIFENNKAVTWEDETVLNKTSGSGGASATSNSLFLL